MGKYITLDGYFIIVFEELQVSTDQYKLDFTWTFRFSYLQNDLVLKRAM